jgi:hypothetical protein
VEEVRKSNIPCLQGILPDANPRSSAGQISGIRSCVDPKNVSEPEGICRQNLVPKAFGGEFVFSCFSMWFIKTHSYFDLFRPRRSCHQAFADHMPSGFLAKPSFCVSLLLNGKAAFIKIDILLQEDIPCGVDYGICRCHALSLDRRL